MITLMSLWHARMVRGLVPNFVTIYHCTSDLGGAEGQVGSLQEQMVAEGLSFHRKILSTGWFNIE